MGFSATIAATVLELRAAGIEATADLRDLNPPAVLVLPDALLEPAKLCGTGRIRLVLELVARDVGDVPALDQLEVLYDLIRPVVERRLTSDEVTFTRSPAGSDPTALPRIRLTLEQNLI